MIRARYDVNTLWKLTLVTACAAMVVLWPNWRAALQTLGYYRMTGGGVCTTTDHDTGKVVKVTHGFELHCNLDQTPNNLQVNWSVEGETGVNRFHLTALQTPTTCDNNPNFSEVPPEAGFDTYFGSGTGKLNGVPGAEAFWVLTDQGEPGKFDTLDIVISQGGEDVLDVTCTLKVGNHQAHKK